MKGLKVFLFITFLFTAVYSLLGLFSPGTLAALGMAPSDTSYTRVFATATFALALAMWYTFRDPVKNIIVVRVVITWLGLEALVLLISGINGSIAWSNALPGVISDVILTAGLAIFYPRAKKAT